MKRGYLLLGVIAVIAAGVALVDYLRNANIPVLEPAGPIALAERHVIIITFALCGIVVIPVFFLLFYFAWKYRADSPNAEVHHEPGWDHDSRAAEAIWWLVPTAIIVVLAVIAWQSSHALDPYKSLPGERTINVEVVALDWKWLFIYPQLGIASVNMLEFPENVPIHFDLTADAPMNSFWIPQLGGQIMVMPGMSTQLNLEASRTGDFAGSSANISGDGFAGMTFIARAVSQNDFNDWVRSIQESSSTPLTISAYQALAAPSEYDPVAYYSQVDSSLYTAIIDRFMVPGDETMTQSMNSMPMNIPMSTSTP